MFPSLVNVNIRLALPKKPIRILPHIELPAKTKVFPGYAHKFDWCCDPAPPLALSRFPGAFGYSDGMNFSAGT